MFIQENHTENIQSLADFLRNDRIIDLDSLRELSGNDNDFIREILGMFTSSAQDQIDLMRKHLRGREISELAAVAHKFKSSVSILGNSKLYQLVNDIEFDAKHGADEAKMNEEIELLGLLIDRVYQEIEQTALAA